MDVDVLIDKIFDVGAETSVVEWVRRHVKSIPYSPREFNLAASPILRALLEELDDERNRYVVIVASVQSGKTVAPELFLSYLIDKKPGPALWLNTTDAEAKDQSENRIGLLFDEIEPIKRLSNSDKNKMRIATKTFSNGMTAWFLGQNNLRNLQRRSVKYVFGDETWQWGAGRVAEAEGRITAFQDGRAVFVSQAGTVGDQTDGLWKSSDKREWTWSCPVCRNAWTPRLGDFDAEKETMTCPFCKTEFDESFRNKLVESGSFIATGSRSAKYSGFHWNCFSSMSWRDVGVLYRDAIAAAARADDTPMRAFTQKRLAEPWGTDTRPVGLLSSEKKKRVGYRLREPWNDEALIDCETFTIAAKGTLPEGTPTRPLRLMTVDVQRDRFYWVVRSWSASGSSRLYDCGVARRFEEIHDLAEEFQVFPAFVGIDCGYTTDEVFAFCARYDYTALRGDRKNDWLFRDGETKTMRPYSPKDIIRVGNGFCGRHYFSTMRCKDILETLRHGSTELSWTYPDDVPQDYERMLYSEKKNETSGIWEQIGSRPNHFFDCESMNVALAVMLDLVGG